MTTLFNLPPCSNPNQLVMTEVNLLFVDGVHRKSLISHERIEFVPYQLLKETVDFSTKPFEDFNALLFLVSDNSRIEVLYLNINERASDKKMLDNVIRCFKEVLFGRTRGVKGNMGVDLKLHYNTNQTQTLMGRNKGICYLEYGQILMNGEMESKYGRKNTRLIANKIRPYWGDIIEHLKPLRRRGR